MITARGEFTNFAFGKTATQSSTGWDGVASRAVDGNSSGVWANGSVTHTNSDLNAWWQVDLGQVQSLTVVNLWNRVEFPERLSNFYLFVSDSPFSSTDLTATQNQAGVSSYYTAGQGGFPTAIAATGLDYFGARYYASLQGRFTSPDELTSSPLDLATLDSDFDELQPLPYADIANPQSLNKYQHALNNPLIYLDVDGHDVVYANDRLKDRVASISKESTTFAEEINKLNEDKTLRVVFMERGVRTNDEKSTGDAEITYVQGNFVHVTIYIDSYGRTSDSTIEHEVGHAKDARTNRDQLRKDAEKTKKDKGGPNALPHSERPEEKRANQFRDVVEKERKEYRKQQKAEQKRLKEQRKREQQERKRREEPMMS